MQIEDIQKFLRLLSSVLNVEIIVYSSGPKSKTMVSIYLSYL